MADESLEVLSEIHLETTEQPGKDGTLLTRFFAQIPTIRANVPPPQVDSDSEIELDADGDVLVPRRTSSLVEQEFHVPHAMGTHIADVGLQVWAGALLMGDFLLNLGRDVLSDAVLELGAETGLTSVVAATTLTACHTQLPAMEPSGDHVVCPQSTSEHQRKPVILCTDAGHRVLTNCRRTVDINRAVCAGLENADIRVRELDWTRCPPCLLATTTDKSPPNVSELDDVAPAPSMSCAFRRARPSPPVLNDGTLHPEKRRKRTANTVPDTNVRPGAENATAPFAWSTQDATVFRQRSAHDTDRTFLHRFCAWGAPPVSGVRLTTRCTQVRCVSSRGRRLRGRVDHSVCGHGTQWATRCFVFAKPDSHRPSAQ
eukprot:m.300356 g.300356  ORF g.300356 m.300356 type:complete len:372 (-) comp20126_c1_seq10:612-1727(-)